MIQLLLSKAWRSWPVLSVLATLLLAGSAHAQSLEPGRFGAARASLQFEQLGLEDGLAQHSVQLVTQDQQGFLWFGTLGGLHRYDGREVQVFAPVPFDSTSLSSRTVASAAEAPNGDLWVGTTVGGLNRLDRATGTFTRYMHDTDAPTSLSGNSPWIVFVSSAGDLWASVNGGGLNRMRAGEDGRFTHYRHDPADPATLSNDWPGQISEDTDGMIWVGSFNGLNRIDPQSGEVTRFLADSMLTATSLLVAGQYHPPDEPGIVWFASEHGLGRLDSRTGAHELFHIVPEESTGNRYLELGGVVPDPSAPGVLWVVNQVMGIARFDTRTETFTRFRHAPRNPNSLRDGQAVTVSTDRSGMIWIGTRSEGLQSFNPRALRFTHLRHDPDDEQSLAPGSVPSLYEDRSGTLWVTTDIGSGGDFITQFDGATGLVTRHRLDGDPLLPGAVRAYLEDEAGRIWVAGTRGLNRFDPESGQVTRFVRDGSTREERLRNHVFSLSPSPSDPDSLLVGSWVGLDWFDARTGTFTPVSLEIEGVEALTRVTGLVFDASGILWVGAEQGLVRVDQGGRAELALTRVGGLGELVSVNSISGVMGSRQEPGVLWLYTRSGGLVRFDTRTSETTIYTEKDGLANDIVYSLHEDERGTLWVATSGGISAFDPATERFTNYGLDDGLIALDYNGPRVLAGGAGGVIYAGSSEGVTVFHPERMPTNAVPPQLAFTGLRISNEPVRAGPNSLLDAPLSQTESLTLSHDQNHVTFEFAALHFQNPRENQYAYRLEGFDEDWIEAGNRNSATYTNLPAGNYTFRVKAANADGVWNEEGVSVGMHITPPWWATWWAYLGYVLLTLGLLTAAYRARRRRHELRHRMEIERLEAENLRALDHAKSQFFANVSHEFRTPLTLTLGPLDDMKAGLHGPLPAPMAAQVDLARRNAGRVLDLINQILDVARLEAGRTPLRAHPLDLGAFVAGIAQPFQDQADRKALGFEVNAPSVEVWADPAQLEKAIANLLSNAVKFTPEGGTVRMIVAAEGGAARVSVRDSGPGIPAADLPHVFDRFYQVNEGAQAKLGTGIGLALAKEVVDLHGGRLTVESEEGFGSTFTVTLPLGRAHLADDQVVEVSEAWSPGKTHPALPPAPGGDGRAGETPPMEEPSEEPEDDVTTVLVVEDHAEVRAYVRRHLEPAYRVLEASDGEAGLALAKEWLPDLVVSDVMMPKLDGLGLCRALKADPETDFIPVILLTAKAAPEDKLEGLGEHCDDYLTKPFDPAELRARIDNLIAVRTRLRERFRQEGIGLVLGENAVIDLFRPGANGGSAPVAVPSAEEAFLAQVREAVEASMADDTYSAERLAEDVGLSRSQLNRRLKPLLGQSSSAVIRTIRLDRAARLLAAQTGTVSEVAYAVGFKSVSHFSNAFLDQYGCRPSAYEGEA